MKYLKRICIFVFAGIFLLLSQSIHWSDSELWAIGLAKEAFSLVNPSIDYKFLFNALLRSVYAISSTNLQVIEYSRLLFAALGLSLLFLVRWISTIVTKKKDADVYALVMLGTCTLFLSQGFKVRSDLLACVMQFVGLGYFLWLEKNKDASKDVSRKEIVIGILLNCLVLLATPKGVYNLVVNFVFMAALLYQTKKPWIRQYLKMVVFIPAVFFLVVVVSKLSEFKTALDFFISSYAASPQHPAFWELKSFTFVFDAVLRNLPLMAVVVLGYFKFRKTSKNIYMTPLAVASLVSVFVILVHNDRLPFFLFTQMIFPVLLAVAILVEIQSKTWRTAILLACSINATVFVLLMTSEASNKVQIQAQAQIHEYLQKHHDPIYYDATSVLPLDNRILIFPAPQHAGNEAEVLGVLNRTDLSLVFLGNRLYYYFQPFFLALEENYFISIGPGVFAKSHVMRSSHKVDMSEWQKICDKFGPSQRMFVYSGESFLAMKLLSSNPLPCAEPPKIVETAAPFIAFSPFEPLQFNADLSFSNIFDHKPFY